MVSMQEERNSREAKATSAAPAKNSCDARLDTVAKALKHFEPQCGQASALQLTNPPQSWHSKRFCCDSISGKGGGGGGGVANRRNSAGLPVGVVGMTLIGLLSSRFHSISNSSTAIRTDRKSTRLNSSH